jgi:hypothetical protein
MAFLSPNVLDNGLQYLTDNGTRLDICSQEPTTFTEATSTYTLGNKTGLSIGPPEARSPSGRKVVVPAISDGSLTADGTASHYAITDGSAELLATGSLSSTVDTGSGNAFTTTEEDIGIPGA